MLLVDFQAQITGAQVNFLGQMLIIQILQAEVLI